MNLLHETGHCHAIMTDAVSVQGEPFRVEVFSRVECDTYIEVAMDQMGPWYLVYSANRQRQMAYDVVTPWKYARAHTAAVNDDDLSSVIQVRIWSLPKELLKSD